MKQALAERARAGAERIEQRLRPIVEARPRPEQIVLIATLERGAAARYRAWAQGASDADERAALLACAAREEEIAETAEKLEPNAPPVEQVVGPFLPALREIQDEVYGVRSRIEQMAVQALAERVGAGVWRSFAETESDPAALETLERCAVLEEESATYLDGLLAR